MTARELEATAAAVKEVLEGGAVYAVAEAYGLTPSALYRAVKRKKPGFFRSRKTAGRVKK